MTDNPSKPKRKLWRWIIAGVLLLVVSVAVWWNWPRGDSRFVGTWKNPDGDVMVLSRNGSGYFKRDGGGIVWFTWRFEGDRLKLGRSVSGPGLLKHSEWDDSSGPSPS